MDDFGGEKQGFDDRLMAVNRWKHTLKENPKWHPENEREKPAGIGTPATAE